MASLFAYEMSMLSFCSFFALFLPHFNITGGDGMLYFGHQRSRFHILAVSHHYKPEKA